ncbi:hypothetical protein [Treponema pedis]|uniref:hypothetical protein n=1 Tax=Treponema pedis TaxID=409322 RepID=UPI0004244912|nr:hypothetical protein [Treponema pedis]
MKHIYKTSLYRIILNIGLGFFVSAFIALLTSFLIKNTFIQLLIFVGVYAAYIWLVVLDNIITIEVDDSKAVIKNGKTAKTYPLDTTSFRAVITTRRQRNSVISTDTECMLYITPENGNEEMVNCELIGKYKFQQLIEDLGISGDSSPVNKIDTKKEY